MGNKQQQQQQQQQQKNKPQQQKQEHQNARNKLAELHQKLQERSPLQKQSRSKNGRIQTHRTCDDGSDDDNSSVSTKTTMRTTNRWMGMIMSPVLWRFPQVPHFIIVVNASHVFSSTPHVDVTKVRNA